MGRLLTIVDMQKMAQERRGKCLSEEYQGLKAVMQWQCAEGHVWEATGVSVRHLKSWCPACEKEKHQQNLKRRQSKEQIGSSGEKLRLCTVCEVFKPHSEMVKAKGRKDGIRSLCKDCRKIVSRKTKERKAAKEGRIMQEYKPKLFNNLSDEELLDYLRRFQAEHGRPPSSVDLENNPDFPHAYTYYRRFKYNADGMPAKSWLDILVLAGLKPLDYDRIWTAWEYLVEVACEKLRGRCIYQPYKMFDGFRPDIVIVDEKVIVDAATSNYKSQHKEQQFQAAKKAGYSVEYWCLYKTTENGINELELKYVFAEEIAEALDAIGEHELAEDIRNLLEKYEGYGQKIAERKFNQVIDKLHLFYEKNGRLPAYKDFLESDILPSHTTLTKWFGTMENAFQQAGLLAQPSTEDQLTLFEVGAVYLVESFC